MLAERGRRSSWKKSSRAAAKADFLQLFRKFKVCTQWQPSFDSNLCDFNFSAVANNEHVIARLRCNVQNKTACTSLAALFSAASACPEISLQQRLVEWKYAISNLLC